MKKLYWLDLETTGLDPINDRILEIAVSVADFDTPFLARPLYTAVLALPLAVLSPFIVDMHTRNGLLAECAKSTLYEVNCEAEACGLIPDGENYLGGNSIHFDLSFLKVHMPHLAQKFSHRLYDVSAINLFALSLGMPPLPKDTAHRAGSDVQSSIRQAASLAVWFTEQ